MIMKNLNEKFTDEEWSEMIKAKGHSTWRDFIIASARYVNRNK